MYDGLFARQQQEAKYPGKHLESWLSDHFTEIIYGKADNDIDKKRKKQAFRAAVGAVHIVQELKKHLTSEILGIVLDDTILQDIRNLRHAKTSMISKPR